MQPVEEAIRSNALTATLRRPLGYWIMEFGRLLVMMPWFDRMDDSERAILEYLQNQHLGDVVYEPDGNVPPDFLVDGRIAKVKDRYPEWWLALEDRIDYGVLDKEDQGQLRQLIRRDGRWNKIILVNPLNPSRGFEL